LLMVSEALVGLLKRAMLKAAAGQYEMVKR
jgi:hypothetical protein